MTQRAGWKHSRPRITRTVRAESGRRGEKGQTQPIFNSFKIWSNLLWSNRSGRRQTGQLQRVALVGCKRSPSWSDCTSAPSGIFHPIILNLVFSGQTTKLSRFSSRIYFTAPTPPLDRSFEKRSRVGPWPPLSHARNKAKHLVRPDHVAVFSSVVTPDSSCHLWHHYRSDLALFRWQSALMHSGKELGQMGRRIWKVADAFLRNPEGKKKKQALMLY